MQAQIAEYLAQGFKINEVANIVGCEPSVISQLVHHDEGFKELFREKAKEFAKQRISTKYDNLEEKTLDAVKDAIATAPDVTDLVRILETIAKIKSINKVQNATGWAANPTFGIVINMPAHMQPDLKTDENNRIITIGGKSMEAMPVNQVKELFSNMETQHAKRIEDSRRSPSIGEANEQREELKFARTA